MEESYIYDTSRSCSGLLDFGIKEPSKNIGRSVYREFQDTIMVFCQSRNNNLETFESGSVGLIVAFSVWPHPYGYSWRKSSSRNVTRNKFPAGLDTGQKESFPSPFVSEAIF